MFHKKYAFSCLCTVIFVILYFNVRGSVCETSNKEVADQEGDNADNQGKEFSVKIPDPPGDNEKSNDKSKDNKEEGDRDGPGGPGGPGGPPHGGKEHHGKNRERESESDDLEVGGIDIKLKLDEKMTVPPMPFVTNPNYLVFEGVDYDLIANLSSDFYNKYYDCFYWFTHCVRDMSNFHTVCAYANAYHWVSFSNLCQIDLLNCRHRVRVEKWKKSQGIFGTQEGDYYDYQYLTYYHGDGLYCKYWDLRRSVPDDRLNFYIEEDQKTMDTQGNDSIPLLH